MVGFEDWVKEQSKDIITKGDKWCPDYETFSIDPDTSPYSCLMPYAAPQVRKHIMKYFDIVRAEDGGLSRKLNVIDATANIGCDTINFRFGLNANCISLEVDNDIYEYLVENQNRWTRIMRLRGIMSDKSYSINANCMDFLKGFSAKMDFVFFDPPWGGTEYNENKRIMLHLEHNNVKIPIYKVVNDVLKEGFTDTVILKTPYNFNIRKFMKKCKASFVCKKVRKTKGGISFYLVFCKKRK